MTAGGRTGRKPRIASAKGDPAGIGSELATRMAAHPEVNEAVSLLVIGDRRVLDRGARELGTILRCSAASRFRSAGPPKGRPTTSP